MRVARHACRCRSSAATFVMSFRRTLLSGARLAGLRGYPVSKTTLLESRRSLRMKQSRTCLLLTVLSFTIGISGQKVGNGGHSPADILYAQPGKLVQVNGFRLNLYCMGSGSPTVVFDSGWGDWAPAWSKV